MILTSAGLGAAAPAKAASELMISTSGEGDRISCAIIAQSLCVSRNACCICSGVPSTAGRGRPQCAVISWPGQDGTYFFVGAIVDGEDKIALRSDRTNELDPILVMQTIRLEFHQFDLPNWDGMDRAFRMAARGVRG